MIKLTSIIIPVFNRQDLVKETLDSVLTQTYQNWECIIVDDGSTDKTWFVLEGYAKRDNRFKIYKRDRAPKGAPTCRNIGAELSKGEYLVFWDSDDIMAPWCIEERVSFMIENPNLDFSLFQLIHLCNNSKFFLSYNTKEQDHLKGFLSFSNTWGTLSVIWRKEFFNSLGGWNEYAKNWQDPELHIRALLRKPDFKWGSEIPSGVIRADIDVNSISMNSIKVDLLLTRFSLFADIMPTLNSYYKEIFKKAIEGRLWFITYSNSWKEKVILVNYLYENGIIGKKQILKFKTIFGIYRIIKMIPLVKGGFYRIFIKPKFCKYVVTKTDKLSVDEEQELLKRVRNLDGNNRFKLIIKEIRIMHEQII